MEFVPRSAASRCAAPQSAASRSAALASLGALLAVVLLGCSDDAPDDAATDISGDTTVEVDCNPPAGLLDRFNRERQLVLSLATAGGENFDTIQGTNPVQPETFRSVADLLAGLDLSGIPSNPQFDRPEDIVDDLRTTADLLNAAIAAGGNAADPVWEEFTAFYTPEFFARHNASVSYYLSEAGCL